MRLYTIFYRDQYTEPCERAPARPEEYQSSSQTSPQRRGGCPKIMHNQCENNLDCFSRRKPRAANPTQRREPNDPSPPFPIHGVRCPHNGCHDSGFESHTCHPHTGSMVPAVSTTKSRCRGYSGEVNPRIHRRQLRTARSIVRLVHIQVELCLPRLAVENEHA